MTTRTCRSTWTSTWPTSPTGQASSSPRDLPGGQGRAQQVRTTIDNAAASHEEAEEGCETGRPGPDRGRRLHHHPGPDPQAIAQGIASLGAAIAEGVCPEPVRHCAICLRTPRPCPHPSCHLGFPAAVASGVWSRAPSSARATRSRRPRPVRSGRPWPGPGDRHPAPAGGG